MFLPVFLGFCTLSQPRILISSDTPTASSIKHPEFLDPPHCLSKATKPSTYTPKYYYTKAIKIKQRTADTKHRRPISLGDALLKSEHTLASISKSECHIVAHIAPTTSFSLRFYYPSSAETPTYSEYTMYHPPQIRKTMVTLGVIGCGNLGRRLIRGFRTLPLCHVKAVCDRNKKHCIPSPTSSDSLNTKATTIAC